MCGWCLNDISISVQVVFFPTHIPLGTVPELWELNFDLQQESKKKKKNPPLGFCSCTLSVLYQEGWQGHLHLRPCSFALGTGFGLGGGCSSFSADLSCPTVSRSNPSHVVSGTPHTSVHAFVAYVLTVHRGPPDWPVWAVQVTSTCTRLQSALCSAS